MRKSINKVLFGLLIAGATQGSMSELQEMGIMRDVGKYLNASEKAKLEQTKSCMSQQYTGISADQRQVLEQFTALIDKLKTVDDLSQDNKIVGDLIVHGLRMVKNELKNDLSHIGMLYEEGSVAGTNMRTYLENALAQIGPAELLDGAANLIGYIDGVQTDLLDKLHVSVTGSKRIYDQSIGRYRSGLMGLVGYDTDEDKYKRNFLRSTLEWKPGDSLKINGTLPGCWGYADRYID